VFRSFAIAFVARAQALPIEKRKRLLTKLLRDPHSGIALNQHYDADGAAVFKSACALGCEGIVSKRLGSPYRCPFRKSYPRVSMMQPRQNRRRGDVSVSLDRAAEGRILLQ
jgi:hypothetical protein